MIHATWRQPPLTDEQRRLLFFFSLEDDTEEAPWMTMGDLQFWSATGFAHSLRNYAEAEGLPWFVAGMMPILYSIRYIEGKKQLSPDVFVAFVPDHSRSSFDVETEGSFPAFVLEVVSPASAHRDQVTKREAYEFLEVREYALFTPKAAGPSSLQGYRLNEEKRFDPWPLDEQGRLRSEMLGLDLVVRGRNLQAQTLAGELLLTPRESEVRRRQAEEAARQARDEIEHLRRENERLREQKDRS